MWARRAGRLTFMAVLLALPASARADGIDHHAAKVTVSLGRPYQSVSPSFLGLSVEINELPNYERFGTAFRRFLSLLRPPDTSARTVLRLGGESADSSYWGPDPWSQVAPPYRQGRHFSITDAWMRRLGSLVRAGDLKVILDVNLAAHAPELAAEEAAAARKDLPRGSLAWFEIGNEPDNYPFGYVGQARAVRGGAQDWAFSFTISDFLPLFDAYERAIVRAFPSAHFAGPSDATRSEAWVNSLLVSDSVRKVSLATAHTYPPMRACDPPTDGHYPAAQDYLHDWTGDLVVRAMRLIIHDSHRLGVPVRLTEIGSATCGGVAGQTDTLATALWAPDYLFSAMDEGVQGVNVHTRGNGYANAAILYAPSGLYAEPLFYGMALTARALGPEAKLVQVYRAGGPGRLKVWAVRVKGGALHVLYINKSFRDAVVSLTATSTRPASLETLRGPSMTANQTVTLAGQRLDSSGRWQGALVKRAVPNQNAVYRVRVPAVSAALLEIPG